MPFIRFFIIFFTLPSNKKFMAGRYQRARPVPPSKDILQLLFQHHPSCCQHRQQYHRPGSISVPQLERHHVCQHMLPAPTTSERLFQLHHCCSRHREQSLPPSRIVFVASCTLPCLSAHAACANNVAALIAASPLVLPASRAVFLAWSNIFCASRSPNLMRNTPPYAIINSWLKHNNGKLTTMVL